MTEKSVLRQKIKAERLNMLRQEVETLSQKIINKLIEEVDWKDIKSVHIYAPIPSLKEVDTLPLIKYLKENYPQIKVFIEAQSEPKVLPVQKFNLIIVPTLAFDKHGNRLGWGGGYYDKFLATQPKAMKVGLAYQSSHFEGGIPQEAHDIPLNQIITEMYNYKP